MTMVRTFMAVELAPEIRSALAALQARLAHGPGGAAGRWIKPEGIHLTLKFLGDVDTRRLPDLYGATDRACASQAPFEVQVAGLGCFPNVRRPRVVWVGIVDQSGLLAALQRDIERACAALGYAPEERAFTPHLTLARVRQEATLGDVQALGGMVETAQVGALGVQRVECAHIFKSELRPEGAMLHRATHQPPGSGAHIALFESRNSSARPKRSGGHSLLIMCAVDLAALTLGTARHTQVLQQQDGDEPGGKTKEHQHQVSAGCGEKAEGDDDEQRYGQRNADCGAKVSHFPLTSDVMAVRLWWQQSQGLRTPPETA